MTFRYLGMGILLVFAGGLSGCINSNNTVIIIQRENVFYIQNGPSGTGDDDDDSGFPDSEFELAGSKPVRPVGKTGIRKRSYRPRNTLNEASYFRR